MARFAADAVDTRRDYRTQRRRADVALDWAVDRYRCGGPKLPAPPDPEGPRDEIAYYVVGSLAGRAWSRGRWSDEEHHAIVGLLEELIEIEREPALGTVIDEPLLRDLVEHVAQPVEHGGGAQQFLFAERLERGAQARFEARAALLDQPAPVVGERCENHAPVAVGAVAVNEPGRGEPFEHLGDARRAQVGGNREVAHRHLALVAKAEQQAVLRVGELARAVGLAPRASVAGRPARA